MVRARGVAAALLGLVFGTAPPGDGLSQKLADVPPAVRKAFQAEAPGAKVDSVTIEKADNNATVYWADVDLKGKTYTIGILDDGTLAEMNLAVDDKEVKLDACPPPVRATFQREAFGTKVEVVGKDIKYGVTIYEARVEHDGRAYELVVAGDGTLVEKTLIIDDAEVELAHCPGPVRAALHEQARGGTIGDVTRSSGIGTPTYEAEIKIKSRIYLVEVAEDGVLLSKSLEAAQE